MHSDEELKAITRQLSDSFGVQRSRAGVLTIQKVELSLTVIVDSAADLKQDFSSRDGYKITIAPRKRNCQTMTRKKTSGQFFRGASCNSQF